MINKEARHHEQARHQKDDEDHMRRLDPQHRRPQKTRPDHSALTLYPPRTRPIICSTWAIGVAGTMPCPRLKILSLEERRVGIECVSKCRSGCALYHQ